VTTENELSQMVGEVEPTLKVEESCTILKRNRIISVIDPDPNDFGQLNPDQKPGRQK
jgi:hypothetical protein